MMNIKMFLKEKINKVFKKGPEGIFLVFLIALLVQPLYAGEKNTENDLLKTDHDKHSDFQDYLSGTSLSIVGSGSFEDILDTGPEDRTPNYGVSVGLSQKIYGPLSLNLKAKLLLNQRSWQNDGSISLNLRKFLWGMSAKSSVPFNFNPGKGKPNIDFKYLSFALTRPIPIPEKLNNFLSIWEKKSLSFTGILSYKPTYKDSITQQTKNNRFVLSLSARYKVYGGFYAALKYNYYVRKGSQDSWDGDLNWEVGYARYGTHSFFTSISNYTGTRMPWSNSNRDTGLGTFNVKSSTFSVGYSVKLGKLFKK